MSARVGWHADPSGRHQFRWWDGVRWTGRVCDGNVVGDDPVPGADGAVAAAGQSPFPGVAPSSRASEILGHTTFGFEPQAQGDWHKVVDGRGHPLAQLWRRGATAVLCDLEGRPVMGCSASRSRGGFSAGGDYRGPVITGVEVTDATGAPWLRSSRVTAVSADLTATFKQGGERLMQLKVDRTGFTGTFSSVLLLDGQKRRIGGVATYEGPDGTTWWSLDREPALTDPLRTLAFMAPYMARCMIQIG